MYKVGDYIIYGGEGVCRVEAVGVPEISGVDPNRVYYTLKPLYRDGKTYTPVSTGVFMRPVITREQARQLIGRIPRIQPESDFAAGEGVNLRMLSEHYDEFIQSHDCDDLVQLIRTVYVKGVNAAKNKKKLGQIDEKYKKRAEDMLHGELAVALGIPKDEVGDYIKSQVEDTEVQAV